MGEGSHGSVGVLLMAYGAAESLEEIPAYLADILGGRKVPPALRADLTERYRRIGGRSPLLEITRGQAEALALHLNASGGRFEVAVGMRHSAPTIASAVRGLAQAGHESVVAVPMTPYRSRLSFDAYLAAFERAVVESGARFKSLAAGSWHDSPPLISALAASTRRAVDSLGSGAVAVLSAHSLPARLEAEGDPYPRQLRETAEAVARAAGLKTWRFAYQSRASGAREPWLGPDVGDVLAELAASGTRAVAVSPIGFLSDHLETLYDDDILYREQAGRLGLRFARAQALNGDPGLIDALAEVVETCLKAARESIHGKHS